MKLLRRHFEWKELLMRDGGFIKSKYFTSIQNDTDRYKEKLEQKGLVRSSIDIIVRSLYNLWQ